jgi:hypothetical protein
MNEYITKLVQEMLWKPKPLTKEQIIGIRMQTEGDMIKFARAIEERHGIK